MSGICGIFNRDGRAVRQSDLEAMTAAIIHRGPDGRGMWTDGPIGLSHCQLHTTPESINERQPFRNTRGDLVITADARIDNRDDLAALLGLDRQRLISLGDSELILLCYEKWGEQCVIRLLGDFAFAIWDKQQQQLFCAVDYLRARPICFNCTRDTFIFSSQPSGLLPGRLTPDTINKTRIASVFFEELAELDKTTSFYNEINYLAPASYLVVNKHALKMETYWSTDEITRIHRNNDQEYQEELISLLDAAVKCRLRSSGNTAVAMSGGIDSTAVAAMARRLPATDSQQHMTLSGLSRNEHTSLESGFVRQAVSTLSTHPVFITPDMLERTHTDLVALMQTFDSPVIYQNIFLMCLFSTARTNDIRVLLTGAESDTILGLGRHYIAHLVKNMNLSTAVREAVLRGRHTENNPGAWAGMLFNALRAVLLPNFSRPFTYRLRNRLKYQNLLKTALINPEFAEEINILDKLSRAREIIGFGLTDSINTMHVKSFNRPYITWIPVSLDMMGAASGVELRHPFQDKRLVMYCLGLPWQQKNRDGWGKYILRKSMELQVPDAICWRKIRDHVGWEYHNAFVQLNFPELEALANDKTHAVYEYFDFHAVKNVINSYYINNHFNDNLLSLFGLYKWLDHKAH